jgi:hypothetical protein
LHGDISLQLENRSLYLSLPVRIDLVQGIPTLFFKFVAKALCCAATQRHAP